MLRVVRHVLDKFGFEVGDVAVIVIVQRCSCEVVGGVLAMLVMFLCWVGDKFGIA